MVAMLEEPHNKRYLHKNKIYFPKEIILLFPSSNMVAVNTLYTMLCMGGSLLALSQSILSATIA